MQDKEAFKLFRKLSIEALQQGLNSVEKVNAPRWLITLLISPVFLFETLKLFVKTMYTMLVNIAYNLLALVMAPFIGLYVFVDIWMIMAWFFGRIINKMATGKESE